MRETETVGFVLRYPTISPKSDHWAVPKGPLPLSPELFPRQVEGGGGVGRLFWGSRVSRKSSSVVSASLVSRRSVQQDGLSSGVVPLFVSPSDVVVDVVASKEDELVFRRKEDSGKVKSCSIVIVSD